MKVAAVFLCSIVLVTAIPQRKTFLIPQQRSDITVNGQSSPISYEYQIVPSSEYAIAPYESEDYSVTDYFLSPITAIVSIGSTALSVVRWLFVKGSLVLLGMSIVIGLCGLTSYCDIAIENPFSRSVSVPYLDDIHYYFSQAYNKYNELQNWK